MIKLDKFFQNVACAVGLHKLGEEEQTYQRFKDSNKFVSSERRAEFRECAHCHCEIGKDVITFYHPQSCPLISKGSYVIRPPRKCVAG